MCETSHGLRLLCMPPPGLEVAGYVCIYIYMYVCMYVCMYIMHAASRIWDRWSLHGRSLSRVSRTEKHGTHSQTYPLHMYFLFFWYEHQGPRNAFSEAPLQWLCEYMYSLALTFENFIKGLWPSNWFLLFLKKNYTDFWEFHQRMLTKPHQALGALINYQVLKYF